MKNLKSTIAIYDKLKNSLNQWRKQLKKVTIKNRKIISRTLVNENISKDISNSYLDKFYLKLLKDKTLLEGKL